MVEHYATLLDQPDLWECWAFHERLVLAPSQRSRGEGVREFTIVYPDPDREVVAHGTGGRTMNTDLGAWQLYMAWQYGTDWVAGFLARHRVDVVGPQPAIASGCGPSNLGPIPKVKRKEENRRKKGPKKGHVRKRQRRLVHRQDQWWRHPASRPLSLPPPYPHFPRRRQERRRQPHPHLSPPLPRQHPQPRCQSRRPPQRASASQQPQGHSCPGNGRPPPKSDIQNGSPRKQPLCCRDRNSRLGRGQ
jgi:hypothetical protein